MQTLTTRNARGPSQSPGLGSRIPQSPPTGVPSSSLLLLLLLLAAALSFQLVLLLPSSSAHFC